MRNERKEKNQKENRGRHSLVGEEPRKKEEKNEKDVRK